MCMRGEKGEGGLGSIHNDDGGGDDEEEEEEEEEEDMCDDIKRDERVKDALDEGQNSFPFPLGRGGGGRGRRSV